MSPLTHRMPKAFKLELSIASDLSTIFLTNSRKDTTLPITAKISLKVNIFFQTCHKRLPWSIILSNEKANKPSITRRL